jgi:hypothetical protein
MRLRRLPLLPHSACLPGQLGWRAVMAAGGSACVRVSARRCMGRPVTAGYVPGRVRRVGCGHLGGGDEQRACRGSAHGRRRAGGRMEPGPSRADHRDAGLGVWLGCSPALTGMPAIWPAGGGVSPARSPSRAPQAGSGMSARSSGTRGIAGSPRAAGVMLMPESRQPDDGAGKYPEMPMCKNGTTSHVSGPV